jgi:hypothetical protein
LDADAAAVDRHMVDLCTQLAWFPGILQAVKTRRARGGVARQFALPLGRVSRTQPPSDGSSGVRSS